MVTKQMIKLSKEERRKIQKISNSDETPKRIRRRANILLLLDRNMGTPMPQKEIVERCDISRQAIYNIVQEYHTLGIEETLKYKQTKPRRPTIITGDIEARIIALACGKAPEGYGKWTIRLLTANVIELSILETVSRETIRNTLKKQNLNLI